LRKNKGERKMENQSTRVVFSTSIVGVALTVLFYRQFEEWFRISCKGDTERSCCYVCSKRKEAAMNRSMEA